MEPPWEAKINVDIHGLSLEVRRGDITKQGDADAVVNAANRWLRTGGGVAGAIHRAAGPTLEEETKGLAPIEPGEAVITGGHGLPNPWIIHCLGPVYGEDEPADELLASCYRNALEIAEEKGLGAVAFPAISTGAFGFPMEEAARIAFRTIMERAPELRSVRTVRFVLWGEDALRVHESVLRELREGGGGG